MKNADLQAASDTCWIQSSRMASRNLNFKNNPARVGICVCRPERQDWKVMAHHSSHCLLLGTYLLDVLQIWVRSSTYKDASPEESSLLEAAVPFIVPRAAATASAVGHIWGRSPAVTPQLFLCHYRGGSGLGGPMMKRISQWVRNGTRSLVHVQSPLERGK